MIPKSIHSNYLLSEIPEPWRLLGFELRPFSIGHWVLMMRWDCWPPENEEQKVLGMIFCSMTWDEANRWVAAPWRGRWDLIKARWALKRYSAFKRIRLWRMFNQYLEEHLFKPEYIPAGDGGATTTLPTPLHLKVRLMVDFRIPESDVMDYPIRKAMFLIRADQEARGQVVIVDRAEMRAAADEHRKNRMNQEGAKN